MEKPKTYFIKVQGKANIPVPLHIGHNFKIVADCSITQEQHDDDEAGGLNVTYKAEPINIEIGVDNGPTVRAKDPRKNSVKIRNMLWKEYFNDGSFFDFDRIYDEATYEILSRMPDIYREAVKRVKAKENQ